MWKSVCFLLYCLSFYPSHSLHKIYELTTYANIQQYEEYFLPSLQCASNEYESKSMNMM